MAQHQVNKRVNAFSTTTSLSTSASSFLSLWPAHITPTPPLSFLHKHLHVLLAMYDYSISNFLLPQHFDSSVPPVAGVFALPPPPPPFQDQLATHAFDSIRKALATLKSEGGNNNLPSPSSLPSYLQRPIVIQRSASSHSLQKDVYHPLSSPCEEESMRKVFSTGDLQVLLFFSHL